MQSCVSAFFDPKIRVDSVSNVNSIIMKYKVFLWMSIAIT